MSLKHVFVTSKNSYNKPIFVTEVAWMLFKIYQIGFLVTSNYLFAIALKSRRLACVQVTDSKAIKAPR